MPALGAQAPTGHIYIEVTTDLIRQKTPEFGIFASGEPYTTIEQFIKGRGIIGAEVKDLIDGTRGYRLPNTALGHFPENPCKPGVHYLPFGNTRIPILTTDPTAGKPSKSFDWLPVG